MSEPSLQQHAEPVRILSDLHLGHPASNIESVDSLRPLVAGAKTVIFNGDTCELSCAGWRESALEHLSKLKQLCTDEGAGAVFLPGNHDPGIAEVGWLELADGKLLVTHGHMVFPSVAPWSHEYLARKNEIEKIINDRRDLGAGLSHQWETTRLVTAALQPKRTRYGTGKGKSYLLSSIWPPRRCLNILRVWATMTREATRFIDRYRPEATTLIFGHFHRSGLWQREGRVLCNTGAFMRGARPMMVELKGGSVSTIDVVRKNDAYRAGRSREISSW